MPNGKRRSGEYAGGRRKEEGGRRKEHSLTPLSKGIIIRRTLGKARAIL